MTVVMPMDYHDYHAVWLGWNCLGDKQLWRGSAAVVADSPPYRGSPDYQDKKPTRVYT